MISVLSCGLPLGGVQQQQVQQLHGADCAVRDPNTFAIITRHHHADLHQQRVRGQVAESLAQESPKATGMM